MNDVRPSVLLSNAGPSTVLTDTDGVSPDTDSVLVMVMVYATGLLMRWVRQAKGRGLTDMAAECGVSASVLSRVELARREPRLSLLLMLCNLLGVRFSDVMRMAEDEAFPMGRGPWTVHPVDLIGRGPWGGDA
jgi:DNA-binding XRE family transcriptional regulator